MEQVLTNAIIRSYCLGDLESFIQSLDQLGDDVRDEVKEKVLSYINDHYKLMQPGVMNVCQCQWFKRFLNAGGCCHRHPNVDDTWDDERDITPIVYSQDAGYDSHYNPNYEYVCQDYSSVVSSWKKTKHHNSSN